MSMGLVLLLDHRLTVHMNCGENVADLSSVLRESCEAVNFKFMKKTKTMFTQVPVWAYNTMEKAKELLVKLILKCLYGDISMQHS